jgi:LysM repeat protein
VKNSNKKNSLSNAVSIFASLSVKYFLKGAISLSLFFLFVNIFLPIQAFAIFWGSAVKDSGFVNTSVNSQRMSLLEVKKVVDPALSRGGGDIAIVGGTALMPESGPVGTMVDVEEERGGEISTYVVRKGDNVQVIAKMFDVSPSTIIWANDIKNGVLREGDTLVILPISGVQHEVKKGDTVESIAKKYKADSYDISRYNEIDIKTVLAVGDIIIVPDGEVVSQKAVSAPTSRLRGAGGPNYEGYYLRPIIGGRKSQSLHGYNGVDLATYVGAPIFASAEGDVIVAMKTGWNGGYGKYIVISHSNNTQTLYAHASETLVNPGDHVVRGQIIGLVGSTGKSTGSHLHFEIRGAKNPF